MNDTTDTKPAAPKRTRGCKEAVLDLAKSDDCNRVFDQKYMLAAVHQAFLSKKIKVDWTKRQVNQALNNLSSGENPQLIRQGKRQSYTYQLPSAETAAAALAQENDPIEVLLEAMKLAEPRIRYLLRLEAKIQEASKEK